MRAAPILLFTLLTIPLVGCPATCRNTCEKLVEECDLHWQQGYNTEDCRVQCELQEEWYEDDLDATEAFEDHLACLRAADCEELDADPGICRDDEVYLF